MNDSVCGSERVPALDVSVPVDVIGVVIEASRILILQASLRPVAAKILEAGKKACQTTCPPLALLVARPEAGKLT